MKVKYLTTLLDSEVNKFPALKWLTQHYFYSETEGFLVAIQDKVIKNRNYEKYLIKENMIDICRKCGSPGVTIEHISSRYSAFGNNTYLSRHNQIAICSKHKLLDNPPP